MPPATDKMSPSAPNNDYLKEIGVAGKGTAAHSLAPAFGAGQSERGLSGVCTGAFIKFFVFAHNGITALKVDDNRRKICEKGAQAIVWRRQCRFILVGQKQAAAAGVQQQLCIVRVRRWK